MARRTASSRRRTPGLTRPSRRGAIPSTSWAIRAGASDYLAKPIVDSELSLALDKALRQQALLAENKVLRERLDQRHGLGSIVGSDYRMVKAYELIEAVAPSKATVLMTGESGTGKSVVARAIHQLSPRASKPYVEIHCGSIPETLLESELFGYVRGAFTDAKRDRRGLFQEAQGGTLFLDEISEIPLNLQAKLLRVIEDKEVRPLGTSHAEKVDTRIVAATNQSLQDLVRQGKFRQDLFYRLNVINLTLCPLRERVEDIPLLIEHFIDQFSAHATRKITGVTTEALDALLRYSWPGNIREWQHVIERAVLFCDDTRLGVRDLTPEVRGDGRMSTTPMPGAVHVTSLAAEAAAQLAAGAGAGAGAEGGLREQVRAAMARLERELIVRALQQTGGNVTRAARLLKISRKGLQLKMKELGLREHPT